MPKPVIFDLPINGVMITTLEDLRDCFTTEGPKSGDERAKALIAHFRKGKLAMWLRVRGLDRELAAVEEIEHCDDKNAMLKDLCRVLEIDWDDDSIATAVRTRVKVIGDLGVGNWMLVGRQWRRVD